MKDMNWLTLGNYELELILKGLQDHIDKLTILVEDPDSGETDDEAIEIEFTRELIRKIKPKA